MKCGSLVLRVPARRKGSGKPYERVKETVSWWGTLDRGIRRDKAAPTTDDLRERGYTECDGNIIATVAAVDEPDWGCTFAKLQIDYKCDKCGQEYFPELPADMGNLSDELSRFVTEAIGAISDDAAENARQARLKEHEGRYGELPKERLRV